MSEGTGQKHAAGKIRFELINGHVLKGIARVLTFGAAKYAADSWQGVPEAFGRYKAAQDRHWHDRVFENQETDPESGIEHAYHFMCNAMFLTWFMVFRPEMVRSYAERHAPRAEAK